MNSWFFLLVFGAFAAFVVVRKLAARPRLPAHAALAAINEGRAVLVDVREPAEWRDGVAAPAHLLPLSDLRGSRRRWQPFLERHGDRQLLLYCHSGVRSSSAAALLRREGFDAVNLGSLHAWVGAGLPTAVRTRY